ncbi:MAG: branched-chain amino acid ABC transporter permease [Xanthobacteraceae bacterium]
MIDLLPVLLVNGIVFGAIYGITAVGIGIIYNTTGIINFAQGEFSMLGGMLTYALYDQAHFPLPVAIVLAVTLTVAIGLLAERIAIRPLWRRGAKDWSFVFVLFAVAVVLQNVTMLVIGRDPYAFPAFGGIGPIELGSVTLSSQALWVLATAAAIAISLQGFFNHTYVGKAMKATAVNRNAAAWYGIPVEGMVILSFGLAALLGAVGGVIFTPITSIQFDSGVALTLKGFAAAILGGFGNIRGAVVGGIAIGLIESLSTAFISSTYSDSFTYGIMIAILLLWPSGLFRSLVELKREEL